MVNPENTPRIAKRRAAGRCPWPALAAAVVMLSFGIAGHAAGPAAGDGQATFETLDRKVQGLKEEVMELNRDLFVLEEELLFPANTQVAVFVSLEVGELFKLESVQLKINDKVVANYLYTDRELAALRRGGVQRLYIGNVRAGKHEMVAIFTGQGPHERDYRRGANIVFEKQTGPKFIELRIADVERKQQPEFVVKQWQD